MRNRTKAAIFFYLGSGCLALSAGDAHNVFPDVYFLPPILGYFSGVIGAVGYYFSRH